MALPFDLTNIEVTLLVGECYYSSKTGWIRHTFWCECIGGGPLGEQIAKERSTEIEERRKELYKKYSSPEYFKWLKSINDALNSYDGPILIDTSTYDLPLLTNDFLDQGYNFVSKNQKNWYLVKNPSWDDYPYLMFAW